MDGFYTLKCMAYDQQYHEQGNKSIDTYLSGNGYLQAMNSNYKGWHLQLP